MSNRSNQDYDALIAQKFQAVQAAGFEPYPITVPAFEWQAMVIRHAIRQGRYALFEACGMGKTLQLLEWARQVARRTGGMVMILCPLAVAEQTVEEGVKFGVSVNHCHSAEDLKPGVNITNYDRIKLFEGVEFAGVVLDESSLLKSADGKTRRYLTERFSDTPYRLCCTATPAPNDYTELGQHAEFLGICTAAQMLATYFINDTFDTGTWRLKGHSVETFWRWVSSWAACISMPSDLGFPNDGYELPPVNTQIITVHVDHKAEEGSGELFRTANVSATNLHREMRRTMPERVKAAADVVNASREQFLVWTEGNEESAELTAAIPGSIEVKGSDSEDFKVAAFRWFCNMTMSEREESLIAKKLVAADRGRVLVSKTSIFGFGANFQHCWNEIYVGMTHSYERFHQGTKRIHRFGQTHEVNRYIVQTDTEDGVMATIMRKQDQHETMVSLMQFTREAITGNSKITIMNTDIKPVHGDNWTAYHGDCVRVARTLADESVDFTIHSPPFASLFVYSSDAQDMGNCEGVDDFMVQYGYLIDELLRVTTPGRECAVHCCDLLSTKWKDGDIELKDFSGAIVQAFRSRGWLFHSRITIWKSPVTEMQRTKAHGLLYKTLQSDSSKSRVGAPDYLLVFKKKGDNPKPITHTPDDLPLDMWQELASPVWMTVDQGNVLNGQGASEHADERHICLAAGSLVLTREHGYLEIEEVEPGDFVLTHKGRWMPVMAKRCNGIAETVTVSAQGVACLTSTPDHKLWAKRAVGATRAKLIAKDPEWMDAETTLGSFLNLPLPPVEDSELTEDEWWIVGRWIGDGHRGGHRRSGKRGGLGQFFISCNHNEVDELTAKLGGHAGHAAKVTATQIALVGLRKVVRAILDQCGNGAENKRLPGCAFTLDEKKSESLLSGYLSADGHYVEKYDRLCASSVSRALLLGMAMVAQRARGVVASVYAGRPDREGEIQGRKVNMMQDWIFSFRNSPGYRKSGFINESGAWKKVRKIELSGEREVWDLQVAGDESFVAEGAVVHNCPLQLDVINRALHLWSARGDTVFSPFMGIGSEGYCSLRMGRKFIGSELKESYFKTACENLRTATSQLELFSALA